MIPIVLDRKSVNIQYKNGKVYGKSIKIRFNIQRIVKNEKAIKTKTTKCEKTQKTDKTTKNQ